MPRPNLLQWKLNKIKAKKAQSLSTALNKINQLHKNVSELKTLQEASSTVDVQHKKIECLQLEIEKLKTQLINANQKISSLLHVQFFIDHNPELNCEILTLKMKVPKENYSFYNLDITDEIASMVKYELRNKFKFSMNENIKLDE